MRKLLHNLSPLFGFLLLALSLWAISSELREYTYRDIFNSLAAIPPSRLGLGIGLTSLGYLAMTGYDTLAFRYIRRSLSYKRIAFTSFISYAASNTIGFALLTGSAIRYRFYSAWEISAIAIAQVIAFANFSFWLGLFAVGGVMFLLKPLAIPTQVNLPFISVRPIGFIFLLLIAMYLLGSIVIRHPFRIRGREFGFPDFGLSLAQIGVSILDWSLAALVLFTLFPHTAPLSYLDFLGIYLLAMTAGVVSNVPGGLGVFETVILLLLSPKLPAAVTLGSLLAYRGVYYFLPLVVATGLVGLYEIYKRVKLRFL